ncbi:enkurin [Exaiptasia diaphana]|uniref:Enkurin domain-containing protein n=1 Tax=Exaiptasia diaphana TaxID=2652724 RepID=A0A913Y9Z3_EXADI|nr:enkurin [Exaiptasia diaphana]KXJ28319.1 Enkurin [Exaiptasia diaphana]
MALATANRFFDNEESIYNLIPQIHEQPQKAPKYRSTFSNSVRNEFTNLKTTSKTMGPPKVPLQPPNEFLKKRSKEPQLPEKTDFKYADDDKKKPSVPKHNEKPLMGIRSNKNFIKTNAVENIMSVPKKPEKKFADTRIGATHPLTPSGLTPKFTQKKDYGRTPEYLERRKAEVERAQRDYEAYVQERMRQGAMRKITGSERQGIIDGLKKNWEDLHHQYQGLSVVTDTAPKKARKERMEAEMKQLERDIETIEKHRVIYIAN